MPLSGDWVGSISKWFRVTYPAYGLQIRQRYLGGFHADFKINIYNSSNECVGSAIAESLHVDDMKALIVRTLAYSEQEKEILRMHPVNSAQGMADYLGVELFESKTGRAILVSREGEIIIGPMDHEQVKVTMVQSIRHGKRGTPG